MAMNSKTSQIDDTHCQHEADGIKKDSDWIPVSLCQDMLDRMAVPVKQIFTEEKGRKNKNNDVFYAPFNKPYFTHGFTVPKLRDAWNGDLFITSRKQRGEGPSVPGDDLHEYFNQVVIEFDGERIESPAPPDGFECIGAESYGDHPKKVLVVCLDQSLSISKVDLDNFIGVHDDGRCWAHDWLCCKRVKSGMLYLVEKRSYERVTKS